MFLDGSYSLIDLFPCQCGIVSYVATNISERLIVAGLLVFNRMCRALFLSMKLHKIYDTIEIVIVKT